MIKLELTMDEFNLFRDYIYKKAGINYTEKKVIILQNRIRRRLRALSMSSYMDYYNIIKNKTIHDEEVIKFFDAVTTNETSFFRHEKQFHALEEMIIPEILKGKSRKQLNIWSAAASMGKEAYTIAMIVNEMAGIQSRNVKILGTDLNSKVLEMAKHGEYSIKDTKEVDRKYLKYLVEDKKNEIVKVKDQLKDIITFKRFNL